MVDMEDTVGMRNNGDTVTDRRLRGTVSKDTGNSPTEKRGIVMLKTKLVTWTLGLFTTVSFLLCVLYGLVTPESLHMHQFLEMVLPAFTWLSFGSFVLGLVESFLWGVYLGLGYSLIYNFLHRKWFGVESS